MRKTNSRRPTRRRRALLGHGIERLESRELLAISVVSSPFDPWGTGNAESLANPGAVSADGRYAVFESAASDLIAADGNSLRDVFLRDLQTGVTSRVSTGLAGAEANGISRSAVISANGLHVAFVSTATNLVANDTNNAPDVFVKNLQTGVIRLVSSDSNGNLVYGVCDSDNPAISADGQTVAFFSYSETLVPDDNNGYRDIFVKNLNTEVTTRISTDANGNQSNSDADTLQMTPDGRYVVFQSFATNLVADDTNGTWDIFRKDLQTGAIVRATTDVNGLEANGVSGSAAVSADGRYVAFHSAANNLVSGDLNDVYDIFVKDLQTGTIVRANTDATGFQANALSSVPALSADGRYVAFQSVASNLVAGDTNGVSDVFRKDLLTGAITRVSLAVDGSNANAASTSALFGNDGQTVLFVGAGSNLAANDPNSAGDVYLKNLTTGSLKLVSQKFSASPSLSGNNYSYAEGKNIASADGRYIVFQSYSTNLVAGDTNGTYDIFVKDLQTGITTRVSTDSAGTQANSGSNNPVLSADGRYVVFQSSASNLVAGDTNNTQDIFVKDLQTGTTTRVSTDSAGDQANSHSYNPVLSADGRYVVFQSYATNLVDGDTNNTEDIFVKDLQTGTTTRVNTDSAGTQANGSSYSSSPIVLSADGRYVVFHSYATNLVAGDTNNAQDIFVKDLQTGITTCVSTDSAGTQGDRYSFNPVLSADGRYVAFHSYATNLVVGDTNGYWSDYYWSYSSNSYVRTYYSTVDVFVKDLQTGITTRVSTDSAGAEANSGSNNPVLSADGRYVVFQSSASNLVAGDTNNTQDIFVKDLQTGITTRVSTDSAGAQANSQSQSAVLSADGRYVVFQSYATNLVAGDTNGTEDIFVKDLQTGTLQLLTGVPTPWTRQSGNSSSTLSKNSVSGDGRYVTFQSYATNLVAGDTNNAQDIFVKDLQTGITTLVSTNSAGTQANNFSESPVLSADGRYVVFQSYATNLVDGDTNNTQDIFVKDLQTGVTTRVSTDSAGAQVVGYSYNPVLSADGRYVAFQSYATNLVDGDTNNTQDIFVKDLQTGITTLVSTHSAGTQANNYSESPVLSADGRYVAFRSYATNLVDGDTNNTLDIFVKDLQTGITNLVSTNSAGVQANSASSSPVLSADGRYVAFHSYATNLVDGDTNGIWDIFVKDLQTGVTTRVNTNSAGGQANYVSDSNNTYNSYFYEYNAVLSADGRYFAFYSNSTNLVAGDTNNAYDIFVKDLQTGTTIRVNTNSSGYQADGESRTPVLSADGRYVAFHGYSNNLVAGANGYNVFITENPLAISSTVPAVLGVFQGTTQITTSQTGSVGGQTLSVAFDSALSVAGGAAGTNSVLNPANWSFFRNNVDVSSQISGITYSYNPVGLRYEATLHFASPLTAGDYRVIARATIQSVDGIGIDGDNNGLAGGDYEQQFALVTALGDLLYVLEDPDTNIGQEGSQFGYAAATDGNFTVVGVPNADVEGLLNVGQVKIYHATTGALLHTLNNPSPSANDSFGCSVAISGNTIVIGASGDDMGATDTGAAYVFNATTGALIATLNNPTPDSGDAFGISVAISGNTIVVGATDDDTGATNAGSAYVFNATTGALITTLNNPAPAAYDQIGYSVAISGNTAVVGGYGNSTGATNAGVAYVFNVTTGALIVTLNNPNPATGDYFGTSVAISGNTIVVSAINDDSGGISAGAAYVFNATTGALTATLNNPNPATGNYFGGSVAISGNTIAVGTYNDDAGATNAGAVYVFDATTGSLLRTLSNPTPAADDNFGFSVAISGSRIVVGAIHDDTLATDAGSVYVYNATTGDLLNPLASPTYSTNDYFGQAVATDGNYIVVGAPNDDSGATDAGAVYVYNATTGALLYTLDNPDPGVEDWFGYSVAISGNTVVVGAYRDDTGAVDAGAAYVFNTTTGTLITTLHSPTPANIELFGWSVAISGNTIVVGAMNDDTGADNAGSAYVFNATTGALLHTLNNPTPATLDQFGNSVAISGNTIVVGAYQDDTSASDAGMAYVFNSMTGELITTLNNPAPATSHFFASSVAISGNTIVVGAYFEDTGAENAGAAYIFNATTGALITTLHNPTPAADDRFGSSVAISGNTIVVGAIYDESGAQSAGSAYVFDATTGLLLRTLSNPTPAIDDNFGWSVAISGNTIAVGAINDDTLATDAGSVYVYNATTGDLLNTLANTIYSTADLFGYAVATDGNYIVVGADHDDSGATDAGAVYVYNATTGALLYTLGNPYPELGDLFGFSVAISGNTIVVGTVLDDTGATDAGTVYVFDAMTGALRTTLNNPSPAADDYFGFSVAISGNTIVVGAYADDMGADRAGSAYVYDATTGALLSTLNNPTPAAADYFGYSVAISGNTIVVGTHGDSTGADSAGSAYVYNASTGMLLSTLNNPSPAAADYFGYSVAISGNTIVVGAYADDMSASADGSVYVYNATTGTLLSTLNNPTPATSDQFGYSVAISGNTIVIGALGDDTGATDSGSAYVFNASTGALLSTLNNPTPTGGDNFGTSVAISNEAIVVGTPNADGLAIDRGEVAIFAMATTTSVGGIDDGDADDTVLLNQTLTYTVTFSSDVDHTTFTAADLDNAGTATLSYGTFTETFPGVFTIQVTPTSPGTIQLRIPGTASIQDSNGLNVEVPFSDDTTVTVLNVNTAPSFTRGSNIAQNDNGISAVSIPNWATAISAGPSYEASQSVTFEVEVLANPGLFSVAPTVSAAGTLSFTPVASPLGGAILRVRAVDDGGTANGGVNTSPWQTFTITLNAGPGSPVGSVFAVNTTTANDQLTRLESPGSVAMAPNGDFIVGWTSTGQDGSGDGIYAQRFNAAGVPQGPEFQVNTTTGGDQRFASVAVDSQGNSWITWESENQDGSGWGIYARRFAANGTALSSEFLVTNTTAGDQRYPSVALSLSGEAWLTWQSLDQDGSDWGIYARRFDNTGSALGNEFLVNTTTANFQTSPNVALDATGNAVIVWQSYAQDGDGWSVVGQRFAANGTALGAEFQINTTSTSWQLTPSVGMSANGGFVVTWASNDQDSEAGGIYARVYNANGVAQTGELLVNQTVAGDQLSPSVAVDADGEFLISWQSLDQHSDGTYDVFSRSFAADGTPRGAEQQLNTTQATDQFFASISGSPGGNAVAVWTSFDTTSSSYEVQARLLSANQPPVALGIADVTVTEDSADTQVNLWAAFEDTIDPDSALSYSVVGNTNPTLFSSTSFNPLTGILTLDYAADQFGIATITVRATDTLGLWTESSFLVTVTEVNDAPLPANDALMAIAEDSSTLVIPISFLLVNDTPGPANEASQTLTITALSSVVGGMAVINGANIEFTPTANYNGPAGFSYTVTDNGTTNNVADPLSSTAIVSLTITEVNDAPVPGNDTLSDVSEDSLIRVIAISDLLINDQPGPANEASQTLTLTALSNIVGGAAVINGSNIEFTPTANYNGPAGFSYTVTDNGTTNSVADPLTNTATVSFTITEVNDAPVAGNDALSDVAEDTAVRIIAISSLLTNDTAGPTNEASQTLTITALSNIVGGTAVINGANIEFTPTANYFGPAGFSYTVTDNGTTNAVADPLTATADVSFAITPVADTPSVTNAATVLNAQNLTGLVITPNPVDQASVTHFQITGITNGTLFQADGTTPISNGDFITVAQGAAGLKFTPALNSHASGSFQAQASLSGDSSGLGGSLITATITVAPLTFVQNTVVNAGLTGGNQRSMVKNLTVTFSGLVTIEDGAFVVTQQPSGAAVTVAVATTTVSGKTVATLTFSGATTENGSLKDGNYRLAINGALIKDTLGYAIDADANQQSGGSRLFGAGSSTAAVDKFFRLYGDYDGDRDVDNSDLLRFRTSQNRITGDALFLWFMDFDQDGDVDNSDLLRFRLRFGTVLN